VFGDPTYADAILDRLVHNAYRIELRGDSMRRRKPDMPGDETMPDRVSGNRQLGCTFPALHEVAEIPDQMAASQGEELRVKSVS
jgi:hypothetical protein